MFLESEFTELIPEEYPRINKNTTIVGIWRKNKIRKMVKHHRNDHNRFDAEKTFT